MKKYIFIFKSEVMTNFQYIINILTHFIGTFILLFIFLNLWQYIYSDPNKLINGYSMNQMIWYVIVTEVLWTSVGARQLSRKISLDVKSGNIAYNLNKPYNYIGYSLSSHLGSISVKILIYIILGIIVGYLFLGSFPNLNIINIILVLLSGILAITINILFTISIGLLSFVIEDSSPIYWLYSKLILVLGVIFPIEYFPKVVQPILNYSPIYAMSYGPAKLLIDFSYINFSKIFISQIIYLIIAYSLCMLVYKKGVKNQIRITMLSIKYALMREMLNKTTFITNIVFMILNNASFLIQWIVLFSLKKNIGGYNIKQVILLWGIASLTYGLSHFFFKKAFDLSETINNGKLDVFLVQPKNVLIQAITTDVEPSAIGDILYGYIMLFIYGISLKKFLLFTLFGICGSLIITAIIIIFSSLSFWFQKSDLIVDTINRLMINIATYPDGIFKGLTKIILYTIIPVGIINYIPIKVITEFNIYLTLISILVTTLLVLLSFIIFNKGLKRYSSSNLMIART